MVTFFVPVQLPVCTVRMSTVDVFQNAGSLTVRRNIACGSSVRQREPEVFVSDGVHLLRLFFLPLVGFISELEMPVDAHQKEG